MRVSEWLSNGGSLQTLGFAGSRRGPGFPPVIQGHCSVAYPHSLQYGRTASSVAVQRWQRVPEAGTRSAVLDVRVVLMTPVCVLYYTVTASTMG